MEFSWQYTQLIRDITKPTYSPGMGSVRLSNMCPAALIFDINRAKVNEVPAWAFESATDRIPRDPDDSLQYVFPLGLSDNEYLLSGPDSILKAFVRYRSGGRILRVKTPKGETYYGNPGVILDEDFNILWLSTYELSFDENNLIVGKTIVHLAPSVFTDDSKSLNKALSRKALPFLLSNNINYEYRSNPEKAKVVIDDCSSFIYKVKKPSDLINYGKQISQALKDSIDEVLMQIENDVH